MRYFLLFVLLSSYLLSGQISFAAAPANFTQAKVVSKQKVYYDQTNSSTGTIYCGCSWRWTGKSGGRVDLDSCGYIPRKNETRAARIEWEHIVPAWTMGHQRQCWQNGGRKNCTRNDPAFSLMEADLHNLAPSIGEVNGDRSNYNYGMVSKNQPNQYGQCTTRTDFKARTTEPRDDVKGMVARVTFYMADRYGLNLSKQTQRILMAWDKTFPPGEWEKERDVRITTVMGHSNPFVTGEKIWSVGYKPSRAGLKGIPTNPGSKHGIDQTRYRQHNQGQITSKATNNQVIIGNRNSHVYHLPEGCPSYTLVAEKNRVPFNTEQEAKASDFRKAGNCK